MVGPLALMFQPALGGVGANKNVSPPGLPKSHVNSRGSSLTRQRLPENTTNTAEVIFFEALSIGQTEASRLTSPRQSIAAKIRAVPRDESARPIESRKYRPLPHFCGLNGKLFRDGPLALFSSNKQC